MLENKYDMQFAKELTKLVKAGKIEEYNLDLLFQIYTNATIQAYLNGVIEGSKI